MRPRAPTPFRPRPDAAAPAGGPPLRRPSRLRLALFASGDFAFNLYWQSVTLYLLFYYTEALRLPMAAAAAGYAAAAAWDGAASLAVGLIAERYARPSNYRYALIGGAVPLGLAFVLAYTPPAGAGRIGWIVAGHLVFRTAYALVNVPYAAMSARISAHSGDRAFVAGGRMLAGTLAAMIVAVGTVPLGRWLTGGGGAASYAVAAGVFAAVAAALMIGVGLGYRDGGLPATAPTSSLAAALRAVARNRAFVTLSAGMLAMVIAVTVLDKSVLYYFKYALGDEAGGRLALGWMMAVSGIAVPLWMVASRRVGVRAVWLIGIVACLAALALFLTGAVRSPLAVRVFLVGVQASIVGLNFALWALLPDTVEYGQHATGLRVEAALYGIAALLQRIGIGAGTLILGATLDGRLAQAAAGPGALRLTLAALPLLFFAVAGLVMLLNPQHRGDHDAVLRSLA